MEDKKLHVLFLSSWFPTNDQPTLGNFVKRHALSVAKHAKVTVIHAAVGQQEDYEVHEDSNYTEVIYYHPPRKFNYFQLKKDYDKSWNFFEKECQGSVPDIIHLNVLYPAGRIALAWQKKWQIPMIVSEHWTGYHDSTHSTIKPWQRRVMIEAGKRSAFLCPVTDNLAQSMQRNGIIGNYFPVPNVVNTDLFVPSPQKEENSTFRFLHVSSLFDQHKNVTGLLEGFKEVVAQHPNAHLTVLGDGDPSPHQKTSNELGIPSKNIEFAGEQTLDEIAQLMRDSDCFVLFSRYENLPCVIGEAWASGVPVISTDVGGIREHLNEHRGNLIQSEDVSGLITAMNQRIEEAAEMNPAELRSYAVNEFSYDAIGKSFLQLYKKALSSATE